LFEVLKQKLHSLPSPYQKNITWFLPYCMHLLPTGAYGKKPCICSCRRYDKN